MVALTETVSVLHGSVAHRVYYNVVGGVAQWLRRSLAGGLSLSMPDLWLTGDHFVGKLSAVGRPT